MPLAHRVLRAAHTCGEYAAHMTQPNRPAPPPQPQGEVIISGVDSGPRNEERGNLTPTEDHARFQPLLHPRDEPDNEDG